MLKIAATDKSWLQQLVLTERRRLANLHRSALNTDTAIQDHEGDAGYAAALADKKEAPKATAKTGTSKKAWTPDDADNNQDIEAVNAALDHFDGKADPVKVFKVVNQLAQEKPGASSDQLIAEAGPRIMAASAKTADPSPNEPTGYAVESHEQGVKDGELGYVTALDNKVGSKKNAAELKYDEVGSPNTSTATLDHDFELKALAKQLQSMVGSKPEWDPNDPLLD